MLEWAKSQWLKTWVDFSWAQVGRGLCSLGFSYGAVSITDTARDRLCSVDRGGGGEEAAAGRG